MKNKILSYLLGWVFAVLFGLWGMLWNSVFAEGSRKCWDPCDWIKLNTCFPIVWDCIDMKEGSTNPTNAFPYMIGAITKIVMSLILVVCFIFVIYAGILRSSSQPKEARDILKKVAITILLLWFSWVILRIINPNFFS